MNSKLIYLVVWIVFSPLYINSTPPYKIEKQSYLSSSIKTTKRFKPDISVNGILYLNNPTSLKSFYPMTGDLYVYNHQDMYIFSLFTNKSESQYLKANIYEGSLKHQYLLFEIGYLNKSSPLSDLNKKYKTEYDTLETESGLKLGMDLNQVIDIKGNDYKIHINKSDTTITYRIETGDTSGLCEQYNMPGYEMSLKIKNKLVYKIMYGFDYP